MIDIRPVAKKAVKPLTSRADRFLLAVLEGISDSENRIVTAIRESESRTAERHHLLTIRITALEKQMKQLDARLAAAPE